MILFSFLKQTNFVFTIVGDGQREIGMVMVMYSKIKVNGDENFELLMLYALHLSQFSHLEYFTIFPFFHSFALKCKNFMVFLS
jgi:hypothetical protein